MNQNQLKSPQHNTIRTVLRVCGPLVGALGLIFTIVGFGSFFSSFDGFEPAGYFWCAFVGLPLLFVALVMCMFGYVGAFYRYYAGEAAPVAKDAVNYMGEKVQPGVKAVAKAVTEGIIEGQKEQKPKQ
jgi:hypothetical protein